MSELQRFTTKYVDREDRIRLSGETTPGQAEVLWLSRRLIGRLVPHLCAWLEKQDGAAGGEGSGVAEALQGFAQQAALQSLEAQPPVRPESAQRSWLVLAVDVGGGEDVLRLAFRGLAGEQVRLVLKAQPLRQWLGILHAQCALGEWSLDAWPSWLSAPLAAGAPHAMTLH